MGLIQDIIDDIDNRGVTHLFGLRYQVCHEIERLQTNGECPAKLWEVYSGGEQEQDDLGSIFQVLGGLVKYLEDCFDDLPSSIQAIIVDYWKHPEKDKHRVE